MKPQIWIGVVAVAVLAALAVVIVITPTLESPRDRLDRQIDEKVALASRILASYEPVGEQLDFYVGAAATQPVDLPEDQWQTILNQVGQESIVSDMLDEQARRIRSLDADYRGSGGRPDRVGGVGASTEAYNRLQQRLAVNAQKLADALRIVQEAVRMSEGEYRGADHPAATRLETILCYHQAEMLRNNAALEVSRAAQEAMLTNRHIARCNKLAVAIELLEQELKGSFVPTSESEVALAEADTQPADTQTETAPAVVPDAVSPGPSDGQRALRSLDESIALLEADKARKGETIAALHTRIEQLKAEISALEAGIADAQQRAGAAQRAMLELERAADPGRDPSEVERFVQAYEQASAAYRQASREEEILREGGLLNARADAPDFEQIDTAPLVPAVPDEPITPVRGLRALGNDLDAAEALLADHEGVLTAIEQQIAELTFQKEAVSQRLAASAERREEAIALAAQSAGKIIDALVASDRLLAEAMSVVEDQGRPAAARAQQAIRKRISEAVRLNRELSPDTANPRLAMMAADDALAGHTQALEGDLLFKEASIHAQRAEMLAWYAELLARLRVAGVTVGSELPGEDAAEDVSSAWLTDPAEAQAAAAEGREAAIEAGQQALAAYEEADAPLNQLWILRANIGATHFLLANLTTGDEAREHLYQARVEYTRALRNREDRPEAPAYEAVIAQIDHRLRGG